jgi:dipeptidyl aminopeptidase/acylaminoacyl peptidase
VVVNSGIYDLRKLGQVGADSRQRSSAHHLDRVLGSDPADLAARSPLAKAKQITAAVFLAHGGRDTVVPPSQFEAMRSALTKAGRKPEELLFPEEGHGFTDTLNRETFNARMLEFLQRKIGDTGTGRP